MTDQYAPGYLEEMNTRIVAGRAIHENWSPTLVWLASSAGGYVTGQTIPVDDGFTIT